MKSCREFEQELGLCATEGNHPTGPAARHFQECASCRENFRAIQNAASLNAKTASQLPAPRKHFEIRETWKTPPSFGWKLNPVYAGAFIVAAIVFSILLLPNRREIIPVVTSSEPVPPELQRTLNDYRQQTEPEELTSSMPVQTFSHYRVKDAHADWN